MMKHLFAGICAAFLGLGVSQADALSFTAPTGITPGDDFSIRFSADEAGDPPYPVLSVIDITFCGEASCAAAAPLFPTVFIDSAADVADGGLAGDFFVVSQVPAYEGVGGFGLASPSDFVFFDVVSAAGAQGFRVFDLNFKTSANATDTTLFFDVIYELAPGSNYVGETVFFDIEVEIDFAEAPAIPLPAGAPLVISGLAALAMLRRRKAKAA